MALTIAVRPAELDGCWGTWSETDVDNVIRTDMDSGTIMSRRRFTGTVRKAAVSVRLHAKLYNNFMRWFRVNCRAGAIPTKMITPYGAEEVWAFAAPPQIDWIDPNVFSVTADIYQLSGW